MRRKRDELEEEQGKFEEQHRIIQQTSKKLSLERDKVMYDKAAYEAELEAYQKQKQDLDFKKSLLQSEQLKAEQMEHELRQR